jgi:Zn finger protein HypA/HybF involved in hydrogenase expression
MNMKIRDPESACKVCTAQFFNKDLDTVGRCPVCNAAGLMPGHKEEPDYVMSPKQQRENLKSLVRELLQEIKTEDLNEKVEKSYTPKPCKQCGQTFTPRTPAMLICDSCRQPVPIKELPDKTVEKTV